MFVTLFMEICMPEIPIRLLCVSNGECNVISCVLQRVLLFEVFTNRKKRQSRETVISYNSKFSAVQVARNRASNNVVFVMFIHKY